VVITTVAAWITAFVMRRRIRKAIGSEPTETELTSIATWMRVTEEEERKQQQGPIGP
jgi:hypothetical protein